MPRHDPVSARSRPAAASWPRALAIIVFGSFQHARNDWCQMGEYKHIAHDSTVLYGIPDDTARAE
jgi:hypothetical protein